MALYFLVFCLPLIFITEIGTVERLSEMFSYDLFHTRLSLFQSLIFDTIMLIQYCCDGGLSFVKGTLVWEAINDLDGPKKQNGRQKGPICNSNDSVSARPDHVSRLTGSSGRANGRQKKIGPLARNCRWTLLTQLTDRF